MRAAAAENLSAERRSGAARDGAQRSTGTGRAWGVARRFQEAKFQGSYGTFMNFQLPMAAPCLPLFTLVTQAIPSTLVIFGSGNLASGSFHKTPLLCFFLRAMGCIERAQCSKVWRDK